jgi:hypothetical protein
MASSEAPALLRGGRPMRLLLATVAAVLGLPPAPAARGQPDNAVRPGPGLIGRALLDGKDVGIVFRYAHGKVLRHELVERAFAHRLDRPLPHRGLEVVLQGRLHVPRRMTVRARHAGGSVSFGVHTLFVDGREVGSVGDNTQKSRVHELPLGAGTHRVKWVLRGGRFGNNLLRFEDPDTGEALPLAFAAEDLKAAGKFAAGDVANAASEERGWPIPQGW